MSSIHWSLSIIQELEQFVGKERNRNSELAHNCFEGKKSKVKMCKHTPDDLDQECGLGSLSWRMAKAA